MHILLQNLKAERKWPEINQRCNYPVKRALIEMQNKMVIDMLDEVTKFSVSQVTIAVTAVGVKRAVAAWNSHPVEGGGRYDSVEVLHPYTESVLIGKNIFLPGRASKVPDTAASCNNQTRPLDATIVPSVVQAVQLYEQNGGSLSREARFGCDVLDGNEELMRERDDVFSRENPSPEYIFESVLQYDYQPLENAILSHRRLSLNLVGM